jgi:hypothetical protein
MGNEFKIGDWVVYHLTDGNWSFPFQVTEEPILNSTVDHEAYYYMKTNNEHRGTYASIDRLRLATEEDFKWWMDYTYEKEIEAMKQYTESINAYTIWETGK